jgi:type II secretory pathway pseudopilin PulG
MQNRGFTQIELVVTLALLSVGFLTAVGAFKTLARGVLVTRTKSLATNLAQEKIEALKDKSYYRLRVTSSTIVPSRFEGVKPPLLCDPANYPAETILAGDTPFTRFTMVEKARKSRVSDNLEFSPWSSPDTGIKKIIVTVVWKEGGEWKQLRLVSLRENPDWVASNYDFQGVVRDTQNVVIAGAQVEVMENPAWREDTNIMGNYLFSVSPGTYTLRASAPGYFPVTRSGLAISESNSPVSVNFNLPRKASGTVTAAVWVRDHLVISRVVGSLANASGFYQEYVEIFNPTTWTWTMNGDASLKFQRRASQDSVPLTIDVNYITNAVAPGGFYLFANTGTVVVGGNSVAADAVWSADVGGNNDVSFQHFDPTSSPQNLNIIPVWEDSGNDGEGALQLDSASRGTQDRFGWKGGGSSHVPGFFETAAFDDGQVQGLNRNDQFRRFSSTTGYSSSHGPAYDSNNNSVDWELSASVTEIPRNSFTSAQAVVSGTPAEGAYMFADDGLSVTVQAANTGNPPYARAFLTAIATGTWTLSASSGTFYTEAPITVAAGSQLTRSLHLTSATTSGYVTGKIMGVTGAGLPNITVAPGNALSDASGIYRLSLSAGAHSITANPSPGDSNYVTQSATVTVEVGQILSGLDFILARGGKIRGRVTSDGTNALPGIPVSIVDNLTSLEVANVLSASDGYFVANVSTGSFTVSPLGEYGEQVSPANASVSVVNGGSTVFSSTFTIVAAYGSLKGSVSLSATGEAITTGVLIIASTGPVANPPPTFDQTLRSGSQWYYMATSRGDGTYQVDVQSGTYNVCGWYTTFNGDTPTVTLRSLSGKKVSPGQILSNVDMSW